MINIFAALAYFLIVYFFCIVFAAMSLGVIEFLANRIKEDVVYGRHYGIWKPLIGTVLTIIVVYPPVIFFGTRVFGFAADLLDKLVGRVM